MRMPDPTASYDDAEVVWSSQFPDGVGVRVATNLWNDQEETDPDATPIRVAVTTEDGTGHAYLTIEDAKQLVNLLGNAITKAIIAQRGAEQSDAEDEDSQPSYSDEKGT